MTNTSQCLIVQTISNTPHFLTWISSSTPLVATIAAVIAFFAYRRQRRLHQEKLSHDFEFYYQTDKDLEIDRHKLNSFVLKSEDAERDFRLLADAPADDEYVISIQNILNTWERCSHAIKEGLYDEKYLFSIISSRAITAYRILDPYIQKRINMNGKERAYINFRWLITRWVLREEKEKLKLRGRSKIIQQAYDDITIWIITKRKNGHRENRISKHLTKVSALRNKKF